MCDRTAIQDWLGKLQQPTLACGAPIIEANCKPCLSTCARKITSSLACTRMYFCKPSTLCRWQKYAKEGQHCMRYCPESFIPFSFHGHRRFQFHPRPRHQETNRTGACEWLPGDILEQAEYIQTAAVAHRTRRILLIPKMTVLAATVETPPMIRAAFQAYAAAGVAVEAEIWMPTLPRPRRQVVLLYLDHVRDQK